MRKYVRPMRERSYVIKFFAFNGTGPFECFFCTKQVLPPWEFDRDGHDRLAPTIHHLNGDDADAQLENLVLVHKWCHHSHHSSGQPRSAEYRARIAAGVRAAWKDPEKKRHHRDGVIKWREGRR